MTGLRVALGALAALGLSLVSIPGSAAAAPDQVRVAGGVVRGQVAGDVVAFKGLPYAAAPVGDLRWRAPEPAPGWKGVRDATEFGPICPQAPQSYPGVTAISEDCLSLNVWTPLRHAGRKLPVMVWVHGGSFIAGAGSAPYYDGASFARDGVVLVTLNYRLGRLGFFAHPALVKENPTGPVGNYGLLDQIAALKWVKANIAAFGGDAANTTLFGESAGGIAVNLLMASRAADGLFQKVISESGFGRFDPPPLSTMASLGARWAKALGVEGDDAAAAAALRALPVDKLLFDYKGAIDPGLPRPMRDGVVVEMPVDQAFAAGRQDRTPYLLGGNSYEASLFARQIAANPERVLDQVRLSRDKALALFDDGDALKAAFAINTDTAIIEPDRDLARLDAQAGVPVFLYYFSYVPAALRGEVPGAAHGAEVPYVFETLAARSRAPNGPPPPTAPDDAMAKRVHAYWVAFAKTGRPGDAGGIAWPAFTAEKQDLLQFGGEGLTLRSHFLDPQLDAVAPAAAAPSR